MPEPGSGVKRLTWRRHEKVEKGRTEDRVGDNACWKRNPRNWLCAKKIIPGRDGVLRLESCERTRATNTLMSVVCRWIPGHSGLVGNKNVGSAARNRVERGGKQVERWSSLAYIKKNLAQARSKELTEWHEMKMREREVSRRGFYVPWTKADINPILENAPKKIRRAVLPAQGRTRSERDIFG